MLHNLKKAPPGILMISGQAAVISSSVKISLLLLRAFSDNFENC